MKYLFLYNESVTAKELEQFLIDFGYLITLNFAHIIQQAVDENGKIELKLMINYLNHHNILNNKTFVELVSSTQINKELFKNNKYVSALMNQMKLILEYIEPRIERFVKDSDRKIYWLKKIKELKESYIKIVS